MSGIELQNTIENKENIKTTDIVDSKKIQELDNSTNTPSWKQEVANKLSNKNPEIAKLVQDLEKRQTDKKEIEQKTMSNLDVSLNNLTDIEIQSFKGIIDSLNNETILPNQISVFSTMMDVLRQMKDVKKEDIMKAIDTYVDTKMQWKITTEQKDYFKNILSSIKDKWLIDKFISQVDVSLEGQKKWWYDILITKITDTITPDELLKDKEVNWSLNAIFNYNQWEYNKFIDAYDKGNIIQKNKLDKILQTYIKSDYPDIDFTDVTIKRDNITVKDKTDPEWKKTKDVPWFKFIKWDGTTILKGKDWKDITPFFWDAVHGEELSFDKSLMTKVGKNSLSEEWLKLPGMKNFVNQIQDIAGKKMSISEALKSLFDSSIFLEIKKVFSMISLMMADGSTEKWKYVIEQAKLNIALIELTTSIKIWWTIKKKDFDKDGNDLWTTTEYKRNADPDLAKYINQYQWNDNNNEKSIFVQCNNLDMQKSYMEAQRDNNQIKAQQLFEAMERKITIAQKTTWTTTEQQSKTENTEQKNPPQEFKDWQSYPSLSLDNTKPGKVEKKWEWDNQYLTIDWQVISLINGKWSIFLKWDDGQIMEKIISFDKKDNKENIIITDGEKLDRWILEKVYTEKDYSKFWDSKETMLAIRYSLLESSSEGNNKIDQVMQLTSQLLPDQRNKVEQAIAKFKREVIKSAENSSKIIKNDKWFMMYQELTNSLSNVKLPNETKQKLRKESVDKRIQSMWS